MLAQTPMPRMLHAFSESFTCILVHVNNSQIDKFSGGTHGGGGGVGTWVRFCWVCAAGLSEPPPHYSLFCGQL